MRRVGTLEQIAGSKVVLGCEMVWHRNPCSHEVSECMLRTGATSVLPGVARGRLDVMSWELYLYLKTLVAKEIN